MSHVVHCIIPVIKIHGANMGPTWFMSAPDGPHLVPMNLVISDGYRDVAMWIVSCHMVFINLCRWRYELCMSTNQSSHIIADLYRKLKKLVPGNWQMT